MKAMRYTIAWLILLFVTIAFGDNLNIYIGIDKIHQIYITIGIAVLIGITELVEIFDDIRKNTSNTYTKTTNNGKGNKSA